MIRIYARENALQRGNTGTALAGSVAAAIRFLAKGVMTGSIATPDFRSRFNIEEMRRHLSVRDGLGGPVVTWFLDGVPGVNKNTVLQQLTNLKSSGDYARIIREVQQQIGGCDGWGDAPPWMSVKIGLIRQRRWHPMHGNLTTKNCSN